MPDVITVAQTLALVHERLAAWKGAGADDARQACTIAEQRASRICGWLWFGRVSDRLNHARPTDEVRFAVGPTRLRDLVPDTAEPLTLQLDAGLLPLELRVGFRFSYAGDRQPARHENSRYDTWVPVAPLTANHAAGGVWVDRIEGEALLSWLSTGRVRADDADGVARPVAYVRHQKDMDTSALPTRPAGRLDYVRLPMDELSAEPMEATLPGTSLSEWDWLEGQQIELLRREVVVLVDTKMAQDGLPSGGVRA